MADGVTALHDHRPNNIERDVDFEIGDVDAGMADADSTTEESVAGLTPRNGRKLEIPPALFCCISRIAR